MRAFFIGWIAALVALAILDAAWLGVVARDLYRDKLGNMLLEQPRWSAAVVFYLLHTAGIVVFPLALSDNWTAALTFIDLAWGTAVTAVACVAAFLAVRAIA